jgi:hypothetical protein
MRQDMPLQRLTRADGERFEQPGRASGSVVLLHPLEAGEDGDAFAMRHETAPKPATQA